MTRSEPAWPDAPRREKAARRAAERCAITAAARRAAAAFAARDPGGGASSRTFGTAAAHTSHCKSPASGTGASLSSVERCAASPARTFSGEPALGAHGVHHAHFTAAVASQPDPFAALRARQQGKGKRASAPYVAQPGPRGVSHLKFSATYAIKADAAAHASCAVHAAARRRRR